MISPSIHRLLEIRGIAGLGQDEGTWQHYSFELCCAEDYGGMEVSVSSFGCRATHSLLVVAGAVVSSAEVVSALVVTAGMCWTGRTDNDAETRLRSHGQPSGCTYTDMGAYCDTYRCNTIEV